MANIRVSEWRKLPVSLAELCIDTTLRCGQSFRWKKLGNDEWSCALHGQILSLKQDDYYLHYRSMRPSTTCPLILPNSVNSHVAKIENEDEATESLLRRYFNLTPNVATLYEYWSSVDPNFKKRAPSFAGVRILKQDAWETLVAFICSSNNNIVRISQMVNNLCLHYGPLVGRINDVSFHDFPPPEALTGPRVEAHLRELGFGYRAAYIAKTALMVANEKPEGWLQSLRNDGDNPDQKLPRGGRDGYRRAHEELLQLLGVGPKVADCICLMGLGWGEAVPVDTHVWQIAQRDYKFGKGKNKSLTKATYDAVGDHFRELWGKEAGWAHSVLFAADLKTFSERLAPKVKLDVEEVKIKEEDGTVVESKVIVKREYTLHEVKDEFGKDKVLSESPRSQRAKRRRVV
ncbi:putative N-glycosylase lyase [Venustampulla echinocandica]|uniref:DNA-(apurinic or apyrimidinic site) lyase n=1 Tax=Venustampulla echinocandica TaxID=2656787 RepID=A0A370TH30_9HELO|nr:putative N-glycosylase lyase [Venustampulla echinocandica]RDL34506.1 putative N-glycosylase lyase [Venustampulla echinocandica]